MNGRQEKALDVLFTFCTVEQADIEIQNINNPNNMYALKRELEAVLEVERYSKQAAKGSTPTRKLYLRLIAKLKKIPPEKMLTNLDIECDIFNGFKQFPADQVEKVFNRLIIYDKVRTSKYRGKKNFRPINLAYIGKKHGFHYEDMKQMYSKIKRLNRGKHEVPERKRIDLSIYL